MMRHLLRGKKKKEASDRSKDPQPAQISRTSTIATSSHSQAQDSQNNSATLSLRSAVSLSLPSGEPKPSSHGGQTSKSYGDPHGLFVVSKPEDGRPHVVDIIFVHGLGGTSRRTWSLDRELHTFWPKKWLPFESGFTQARILSFGYDSDFMSSEIGSFLNITNFAMDLNLQLKAVADETAQVEDIGVSPIIFVVHSMGGLVVKQAYILALNDDRYREVIQNVSSIVFLATPHHTSAFAQTLKMLLSQSRLRYHPKLYVSELENQVHVLDEINQQFRHVVSRLKVASFFETVHTKVGPREKVAADPTAFILGHSEEHSGPLDTDHNGICRFSDRSDSNYTNIRDTIRTLISRLALRPSTRPVSSATVSSDQIEQLAQSLGMNDSFADETQGFDELRMPGSCQWILNDREFCEWTTDLSPSPSLLWLKGRAGTGKTILAAFLLRKLRNEGKSCQIFYFRHAQRAKRSPTSMLRTLILQMANDLPRYRARLLKQLARGQKFTDIEARLLWQKAIMGNLTKLDDQDPMYWIIDALDECDDTRTIFSLLSTLNGCRLPLRLLVTGRIQPLDSHFDRLKTSLSVRSIFSEGSEADLLRFVKQEMDWVQWDPDSRSQITEAILSKAQGNFLWVRLVLATIQDCHSLESIEAALIELPSEISDVYARMTSTLVNSYRHTDDMSFARAVLSWVLVAQRPLSVQELGHALRSTYSSTDLARRIARTCGEFVDVDEKLGVSMVHDTAREFLTTTKGTPLSIDPFDSHLQIFSRCLDLLMQPDLKVRLTLPSDAGFIQYAASFWSFHLTRSNAHLNTHFLNMVVAFLRGKSVLTWIYMLAAWGNMRLLVTTSKDLHTFATRRWVMDGAESQLSGSFQDHDLLESWATDLVKIAAKFGGHLSRYPNSVFTFLPAFCPIESAIHQQFRMNSHLSVSGISHQSWDDYIARFSVGRNTQALGVLCSNRYFATVTTSEIALWYTDTFEEAHKIQHGERLLRMKFSLTGDLLATCGFRTTKIWDASSADLLYSFRNPAETKIMDVTFADDDKILYVFSEDGIIRFVNIATNGTWQELSRALGDGTFNAGLGSPKLVAFDPGGHQIAIAYRGVPVLVWNLSPLKFLGKCMRRGEKDATQFWADVNALDWNPITGHVVGAYNDGCLFKWYPLDLDNEETMTTAALVSCSPDGSLIVTGSTDGTLRVWNFHTFALVYQLQYHSQMAALTLSPDGRRIYDIRESTCNVWQPNALLRLAEADERGSDTSSTTSVSLQASEATAELKEPITALCITEDGSYCFSGDDDGVLNMINLRDGMTQEFSKSSITLSRIASVSRDDMLYLATADLYGRVKVLLLDKTASEICATSVLNITANTEQRVTQLLFHPDATVLLIAFDHSVELWSLAEKQKLATSPFSIDIPIFVHDTIMTHQLLAFGLTGVDILLWQDLHRVVSLEYSWSLFSLPEERHRSTRTLDTTLEQSLSSEEQTQSVDRVWVANGGDLFVLQLSQATQSAFKAPHVLMVPRDSLSAKPKSNPTRPSESLTLPPSVLAGAECVFGLISSDATVSGRRSSAQRHPSLVTKSTSDNDLLVYIDSDSWICTWSLSETTGRRLQRHFFLPRDWHNSEYLQLATVTQDGMFLCPRNGEVALIHDGFTSAWVDG